MAKAPEHVQPLGCPGMFLTSFVLKRNSETFFCFILSSLSNATSESCPGGKLTVRLTYVSVRYSCDMWFHYGCVAIMPGDLRLEPDALFICPTCQ